MKNSAMRLFKSGLSDPPLKSPNAFYLSTRGTTVVESEKSDKEEWKISHSKQVHLDRITPLINNSQLITKWNKPSALTLYSLSEKNNKKKE